MARRAYLLGAAERGRAYSCGKSVQEMTPYKRHPIFYRFSAGQNARSQTAPRLEGIFSRMGGSEFAVLAVAVE